MKALLFDCDGVLVDTERDGHRVAFNQAFSAKGLDVVWDAPLYGELRCRQRWTFEHDHSDGDGRRHAPARCRVLLPVHQGRRPDHRHSLPRQAAFAYQGTMPGKPGAWYDVKSGADGIVHRDGKQAVSDYDMMSVWEFVNGGLRKIVIGAATWDGVPTGAKVGAYTGKATLLLREMNKVLETRLQHGCQDDFANANNPGVKYSTDLSPSSWVRRSTCAARRSAGTSTSCTACPGCMRTPRTPAANTPISVPSVPPPADNQTQGSA